MPNNKKVVLIKNGRDIIENLKRQYDQDVENYKESLKSDGIFWRATHVQRGQRVYHYWYRYVWDSEKKKTVHKYIGKVKPSKEIPNPPVNPLEGLNYNSLNRDITLSEEEYQKYDKALLRMRVKVKKYIEE